MILIQFRMQPPKYCPPEHTRATRARSPAVTQCAAAPLLAARGLARDPCAGTRTPGTPGKLARPVARSRPRVRRTRRALRCTRRAPLRAAARPRTGPRSADAHAGPWTRVAAAGGRAAAHIAAHMMPSRPINPPTGSSRTPLGASSLVPSASNNADHSWSRADPIDGRGPARACRWAPPRRACYTSHVAWFRVLLRPRRRPLKRPRSFAPIATHRAEDRKEERTERDLWPCW